MYIFPILDLANRLDYAHVEPAFPTWHKYFNLWLEWEMQHMLKSMGHMNYYTFTLPYWDWRIEFRSLVEYSQMISLQKIGLGKQGMSRAFLMCLEILLVMDGTQYVGKHSFRFVIQALTLVPFNVVH